MLVDAAEARQREPAVARFEGPHREPEAAERQSDRQPHAQRSGQAELGRRQEPDKHQGRVAEKDVAEEAPRLFFHQSHPRGIDGGGDR